MRNFKVIQTNKYGVPVNINFTMEDITKSLPVISLYIEKNENTGKWSEPKVLVYSAHINADHLLKLVEELTFTKSLMEVLKTELTLGNAKDIRDNCFWVYSDLTVSQLRNLFTY